MKFLKSQKTSRWTNRIIFIASISGMLLSVYLWSYQVQAGHNNFIIPCTVDGGCVDVLNSDYSKFFGIPMAAYGFFFYAFMTLLAFQRMFSPHKINNYLIRFFWVIGFIFTVYLRYLEFFVINHICAWCWLSVLIMAVIMTALIVEYFSPGNGVEKFAARLD